MANVAAPFGAVQWGTVNGGPPNFAQFGNPPFRIASGYGTAIGFGDLVTLVNGSAPTGYINRYAPAGTATNYPVGVFYGCKYLSSGQKKTVWSNWWPGSDAAADAEAFVCADPNAIFLIQSNNVSLPVDYTYVGMTADVVMNTVNTTTGQSAMALLLPSATTPTLWPFKVVGPVTAPPGVNGTDTTTAFNNVLVTFNNQMFKTLGSVHS